MHLQALIVMHVIAVYTGTEDAIFPYDIVRRPEVVSLTTGLKSMQSQKATFTETLTKESGGNPSKVATSYATADRTCGKMTGDIAQICKEQWVVPEFSTLHWESKLLPTLSNLHVSKE